MIPSKRIVMATFGSLGDLHPYLAIGIGLRARGHRVVITTQRSYREKVEATGLEFHAAGADLKDYADEQALMARVMHVTEGPEFVIRDMVVSRLRQTYDELAVAVEGADMLITHPLAMAGHLIAEKQGAHLTWGGVVLAPSSLWSAYDPPILAPMPALRHLYPLGPSVFRLLLRYMKHTVSPWTKPWHDLRRELGLPPTGNDPLFEGQFSPDFNLALFSPLLGAPQSDWPANTYATGFPFYDHHEGNTTLPPALAAFLDAGDPPLVFTLGSSAVRDAGAFYEHSAQAAQALGRRAVLLIGPDPRNRPTVPLPSSIAAFDYAPYSALLPRAAAIIHQGGVGTTGQAMLAGRPLLVVPFGFDQPDNAARVVRLGIARTIPRRAYTARRATAELAKLLQNPQYTARAAEVGRTVAKENGVKTACDIIEANFRP